MSDNGRGWPLQLAFLLMLLGGAIGLLQPKLFSTEVSPDRTIPSFLFAGAVLSALVLYLPSWGLRARISNLEKLATSIGTSDATAGTLVSRIGNLEKLCHSPPSELSNAPQPPHPQ
jgi:hypothetical protein